MICLSGSLHRLLYLLHGMHSADGAQLFIAGGLHPKGYAVESAAPQGAQSLPVPGGVRVRLKGDFRISGNMIALLHRFQNFAQPLFPKIAGCAAAKINRIDRVGGRVGRRLCQMGAQRIRIGIHTVLRMGQGIEITVNALRFAKGNVQIQAQRQNGFHGNTLPFCIVVASVYRFSGKIARTAVSFPYLAQIL